MKRYLKSILTLLSVSLILLSTLVYSSAAQLGDVDHDSKVTASDARLILRCSVKLEVFTASQMSLGDMDGNGSIESSDARLCLRKAVGLTDDGETKFTVPVSSKTYDESMNLIYTTSYTYSRADNSLIISSDYAVYNITETMKYRFDKNQNCIYYLNTWGQDSFEATIAYDKNGIMTQAVLMPAGEAGADPLKGTEHTYKTDSSGRIIHEEYDSSAFGFYEYSYEYASDGSLLSEEYIERDLAGNEISRTVTTYRSDGQTLKTERYDLGNFSGSENWSYSPEGLPAAVTVKDGFTNIIAEYMITYKFNSDGMPLEMSMTPSVPVSDIVQAMTINYKYSGDNVTIKVLATEGDDPTLKPVSEITYDRGGNVLSSTEYHIEYNLRREPERHCTVTQYAVMGTHAYNCYSNAMLINELIYY